MINKLKSILALSLFTVIGAFAQSGDVGIGTTTPNASAVLDITSTTKGLLIPRMNTAQRTAIATPAAGLQVYDTTTNTSWYYNGTVWVNNGANEGAWSQLGNTLTDSHFIGSTNNKPLNFKVNGKNKLFLGNTSNFFSPSSKIINTINDTIATNDAFLDHLSTNLMINTTNISGPTRGLSSNVIHNSSNNNSATNGGMNNVAFIDNSSGTATVARGNFSSVRINAPTSTVKINNAMVFNTSITNSSTSGGAIRNATGYNVSEILATGTDPGQIHIAKGINIDNNFIASGGDKNLVYPIYSANTQSSYMAGGLGIGVQSAADFKPHASALVEVQSTTQGFLPPRMTASQMSSIANPAEGLVVYCTNCLPAKGLRVFDNTQWVNMAGNSAPLAAFTFTGNYYHLPNFHAGKVMSTDNTLFLEVTVTTIGQITFSSGSANGYSFNGSAQILNTGTFYVPVYPSGTQSVFNSSGDNFTITGVGTSTQTQAITISNVQFGNAYTTFTNGTENFSANTACATKPVSTTTSGNCPATVTVGSNSYNTVFINGQCWMQTNLKEASTTPCSSAINTGCNVWTNLNLNVTDNGFWGYYHNTIGNGNAGWRTTEPAAGEGLLYQWSAAMNGSTEERAKGVCPAGWHIPSDCEFMYLEHGLGMSIAQQTSTGGQTVRVSGDVGGKLATFTRSTSAAANGTGTNSSGFTVLAAGYRRNSDAAFAARSTRVNLWSSTQNSALDAIQRGLYNSASGVEKTNFTKSFAATVRCLKD
jgi:uncharacterized protein (TIGR02145 family)